ncbi:MAG TPA: hypothetical protein PK993_00465, partial [Clostridia bacterium]|nr:hypothetical protein [Clostridia bacterium]
LAQEQYHITDINKKQIRSTQSPTSKERECIFGENKLDQHRVRPARNENVFFFGKHIIDGRNKTIK